MPAGYSVADRSASLTAAARLAELRTAAGDRAYIREIGVSVGVAGASPTIGLIRPNAIGVTPTSPKTAQANDPGQPAGTATSALGAGWIWTFGYGELVVPVSSSLLLDLIALSAATATAIDFYFDLYE
jgi:hypothetical protein